MDARKTGRGSGEAITKSFSFSKSQGLKLICNTYRCSLSCSLLSNKRKMEVNYVTVKKMSLQNFIDSVRREFIGEVVGI